MFEIKGLDHVVLRCAELDPMLDFYGGLLGCAVERALPELGLYQLRAGASLIDLVTVSGPLGRAGGAAPEPTGRNMDHLCLRIDPFEPEKLRAVFGKAGFDVSDVGDRYGAEGTGPSIYVQDPEGNTVELKGPPNEG